MASWIFLRTIDGIPFKFIHVKESLGVTFPEGLDPFEITAETQLTPISITYDRIHYEGFLLCIVSTGCGFMGVHVELCYLNKRLKAANDPSDFYEELVPGYPYELKKEKKRKRTEKKPNNSGDGFCTQPEPSDTTTRSGNTYGGKGAGDGGKDATPQTGGQGAEGGGGGSGGNSGGSGSQSGAGGSGGNGGKGNGNDDREPDDKGQSGNGTDEDVPKPSEEKGESDTESDTESTTKRQRVQLPPSDPFLSPQVEGESGSSFSQAGSARATEEGAKTKSVKEKRPRKKEVYRPSKAYLTERREMEKSATSGEERSFKFSAILHDESERHRDKMAEMLSEMMEFMKEMLATVQQLGERVRRIETAGPDKDSLDYIAEELKIPWKSMADMDFAITFRRRELLKYCNGIYPADEPMIVAKLCGKLIDAAFARTLLYTAPRAEGAGEVQVKVGLEFVKMSTTFSTFMCERIQVNKYLTNKAKERRKLSRYFENQSRRTREEEIARLFLLAVDGSGPTADVCTLLIANDLTQNCGGLTEKRPDLTDAKEMLPWLRRHRKQVLEAVAKSKAIDNIFHLSNQDIISKCLRVNQTMALLRRNAEKLQKGQKMDMEKLFDGAKKKEKILKILINANSLFYIFRRGPTVRVLSTRHVEFVSLAFAQMEIQA